MKKAINLLGIWVIVLIASFVMFLTLSYVREMSDKSQFKNNPLYGKKIELKTLLDTNGTEVELEFDTEVAILNFWYKECVYCLEAMSKFDSLLIKNPDQFTLISVSTDDFQNFKSLVSEQSRFEFLRKPMKNWKHYCLTTVDIHPHKYLNKLYNISYYPAYIVIDKKHEIIDMPTFSISYINDNYTNRFPFWTKLITQFKTNKQFYFIPIGFAVVASILYWITIGIILLFKKIRR